MNYMVPGDILARLLIAAGARMDADEIGEIVHRIKAERTDVVMRYGSDEIVESVEKPAKPEA